MADIVRGLVRREWFEVIGSIDGHTLASVRSERQPGLGIVSTGKDQGGVPLGKEMQEQIEIVRRKVFRVIDDQNNGTFLFLRQ